ncbi:unnamed protein product [Echinostoma caproni]|uniref:Uncharacterized protein n=1 Tax=Echinostoma caproni TaxID=27848 RepID=A0A183ALS6_9TREM|nr:unnamed protein product [Echinostoma caproni]
MLQFVVDCFAYRTLFLCAFRCCYCSHFNPPRQSRRVAPVPSNIAQSVPHLVFNCPPPSDRDSDEECSVKRRVSVPASLATSHSPTLVETNGKDSPASESRESKEDITINGNKE